MALDSGRTSALYLDARAPFADATRGEDWQIESRSRIQRWPERCFTWKSYLNGAS